MSSNGTIVSATDLSSLTKSVDHVISTIDRVDSNVNRVRSDVQEVNSNVSIARSELEVLASDFHNFVRKQELANELQKAQTKKIDLQQQLDVKFGHYAEVRRSANGILQATDVGVVRKETIATITEEMMVKCQGYWLAPCLVALAYWIDDNRDISEKAIKEGVRRDDNKASLLFGLICRRADRKNAAMLWIGRYLSRQNPESLQREAVVILDAYSAGLFYSESDDTISKQISEWMTHLEQTPGFLEKETENWKVSLLARKRPFNGESYPHLQTYSHTWNELEDVMAGALLHQDVLDYFNNILGTVSSRTQVKAQLDEILDSLVTSYDEEELPLREKVRECELIIEFSGDVDAAKNAINEEKHAFEKVSSFTQILTNAVMHPEEIGASSSTQKLALSLSRDWIADAYGQIVAENRVKVPSEIEINIDTFNDKTKDGSDEDRLVKAFNDLIDIEKRDELEETKLKPLDMYLGIGGIVVVILGILMCVLNNPLLGIFIAIIGGAMILRYFAKEKSAKSKRAIIDKNYEEKRTKGIAMLRAVVAEIVDFRLEFEEADLVGDDVVDMLGQLNPDEYVNIIANAGRTTIMNA